MFGFRLKTLVLITVLLPVLASAEIYRWTDETGKVHYSDKAPAGVTAEKKVYVNVATPWRKIPKPVVDKEEQQQQSTKAENPNTSAKLQSDTELSQEINDKKNSKKTKRLKEKQSDSSNSNNSAAVKLNDQDKSSNTPAKRAAEIKETYREAKKAYGNAN